MSGQDFWKGFRNGAATAAAFTLGTEAYARSAASGARAPRATEVSEEEANAYFLHNADSNNNLTGHTVALVQDPETGKWYKLDLGKGAKVAWDEAKPIEFNSDGRVTTEGLRHYERAIRFKFSADQARAALNLGDRIGATWASGSLHYSLDGRIFGLNCTTASILVLNAGGAALRSQGIWNAPQAIFDLNRHKGLGVGTFGTH